MIVDSGLNPVYGVPNPVHGILNPVYGIPNPVYEIPNPVYGIPNPVYGILNPVYRIPSVVDDKQLEMCDLMNVLDIFIKILLFHTYNLSPFSIRRRFFFDFFMFLSFLC
jgi:hypothetical protein